MKSKGMYEQDAAESDVEIMKYRGNNGVYGTKAFKDNLMRRHHIIILSCVNNHSKSKVNKWGMPTVIKSTRLVTLYEALLWPNTLLCDFGLLYCKIIFPMGHID